MALIEIKPLHILVDIRYFVGGNLRNISGFVNEAFVREGERLWRSL